MGILNMVSNFSGVPLAFAYIIMLGNTGILTLIGQRYGIGFLAEFPLYSTVGLMITYIYFEIPLAILLLVPAFNKIKPEWKDAVGLLGGSSFTFWTSVGIPALLPSILSTFSTLFANAIAAYATAYALVMNNVSILPIRISEQYSGDVVQNPQLGGALAVILMLLMILSIVCNQKIADGGLKSPAVICQALIEKKIAYFLAHFKKAQNTHLSPVDLLFSKCSDDYSRAGRRSCRGPDH